MSTAIRTDAPSETDVLGPAEVLSRTPGRARVRLEDGREAEATLAFAFPYEPAVGDELLVIGRAQQAAPLHTGRAAPLHAIGVIRGQAASVLAFPGDAEVRADGVLHLRGGRGVEVEAPKITLRAKTLRAFAGNLVERADTAYRWVQEVLTVRAGESRRLTQGEDLSLSQRSVTLAEGTVKVDGKQVNLGH